MIYVKPDFYDKFKCRADKCRHSCCVGWEIDIDDDTAEYYADLGGDLGRELAENVSQRPEAHFIMRSDGRCPFLDDGGLCRIISALGESALCDICAEHPRFYNCFGGRTEYGLGLCCEESVSLLCSGQGSLRLIEFDDGANDAPDAAAEAFVKLRGELFDILCDHSLSLARRSVSVFERIGASEPSFDPVEWAKIYLTLERMDERWTEMLKHLEKNAGDFDFSGFFEGIRYERIFEYFIYRHLIMAKDMEEAKKMLQFCYLSTKMICALDALDASERDEHLRLYSAEIEYSDRNISIICSKFG